MVTKKLQILDSLIKQAENADTLDGKHADEFALTSELDEKLDKQPGNGSCSQAYVVNAAGEQIMLELSHDGNSDNTIPRRLTGSEQGQINVPLEPTGAMHATSKSYVDSEIHNKAGLAEDEAKLHADAKVKALEQAIPVAESTGGASTITHKSEEAKKNNINGIYSAAFGGCNESNDNSAYSLIGGYENKINGAGKNALLGLRNLSTTDTAFAANRYNVVSALASFALGERNQVSAQNAGALGNRLAATKKGQVVVGKLNAPNDNAMFIVGNGTTNRKNAFAVLEDGTITVGGHFEDDNIMPMLKVTDIFNDYENEYNIGAPSERDFHGVLSRFNVPISTAWTTAGKNTAKFVSTGYSFGFHSYNKATQANLENLYVEVGKSYTFKMSVCSSSSDYDNISFWLAALPSGKEDIDLYSNNSYCEALSDYLIAAFKDEQLVKNSFSDVTVTFTSPFSGLLRIGVGGDGKSGGTYYIGNIRLEKDAPKYNYKSVSGNHTDTLYRVSDIPCEPDYTNDWLVGKTISTTIYGNITITEDMIYTDDENWKDARENCLVIYNSTILMCVVDSIAPTKMDVSELGIYINPIVTNFPYEKWVDEPFDEIIDNKIEIACSQEMENIIPSIGDNANWFIGSTDTGIKANGADGTDGSTPYIGDNGNWWINDTDTGTIAAALAEGATVVQTTGDSEIAVMSQKATTDAIEAVESYTNEIAKYEDLTNENNAWVFYGNAYPNGTTLANNNSYYCYYLVAQNDFVVWADDDLYTGSNDMWMCLYAIDDFYDDTQLRRARQRKDAVDGNITTNTVPKVDSKWTVKAGQVLLVSIFKPNTSATVPPFRINVSGMEGIRLLLGDNVVLNEQQVENVKAQIKAGEKKCCLKYILFANPADYNATEALRIYIPSKVGYVRYDFFHSVNNSGYADCWRLAYCYAVDDSFNKRFGLTGGGEIECAIRLTERSDFSGGATHGDEMLDSAVFFVDGVETDITTLTDYTQFDTLQIIERSRLLDPADHTTVIAKHGKEYRFTDSGLLLDQFVNWEVIADIELAYLTMFTPAKKDGDLVITNKAYTSNDFETIELGNPIGNPLWFPNAKKAVIWGSESGVYSSVEIIEYPTGLTGGDRMQISDNNGLNYNKVYFYVTDDHTTEIGEIWRAKTKYEFKVGEGTSSN